MQCNIDQARLVKDHERYSQKSAEQKVCFVLHLSDNVRCDVTAAAVVMFPTSEEIREHRCDDEDAGGSKKIATRKQKMSRSFYDCPATGGQNK